MLSLLKILPPLQMDSAFKNHLFTSYPLGAYLNAAVNPILLYFRILKKNPSTANSMQLKARKLVAVQSGGTMIKAERKTATIVDKAEENVAVVQTLKVSESALHGQLSFVTKVISRMNSAHKLLKRSLTWSNTMKELSQSKTKVMEKNFVTMERVRPAPEVVDHAYPKKLSSLNSLPIQPISFYRLEQEVPQYLTTPATTTHSSECLSVTPQNITPSNSTPSEDPVIFFNVNNNAASFVPSTERTFIKDQYLVNDFSQEAMSSQRILFSQDTVTNIRTDEDYPTRLENSCTEMKSRENEIQIMPLQQICVAIPIQIKETDFVNINIEE